MLVAVWSKLHALPVTSSPKSLTVCRVFQFELVKVSEVGLALNSLAALRFGMHWEFQVIATVTSAVGAWSSTT